MKRNKTHLDTELLHGEPGPENWDQYFNCDLCGEETVKNMYEPYGCEDCGEFKICGECYAEHDCSVPLTEEEK